MKKSLLALAVLGAFAGAASAQSSVTIYGSIDLAIAKSNGGTSGNNAGQGGGDKAWRLQQSNSSRLGFRGNEDLGGGLSAQFQIEHRYTPDDGAANSVFWAGRSYVQLTSAAAGSVYLGREYTPAFWPAVKSDPFGWDGVGQMGSLQWGGYTAPGNPNGGVRSSNSIGYKSPNLGGLTVQAAVGLSEATGVGRNNGFNVEYSGGPLYGAVGYESITDGSNDGRGVLNAALHYDFGFVKAIGYVAKAKIGAGGNTSSKVWQLGATAPIGPGKLKAAYINVNPDGADNNTKKFAIGYDYPFSKRTNVYVDFGKTKTDLLTNNNTYAFGVKHTF
jgi:predicted porin